MNHKIIMLAVLLMLAACAPEVGRISSRNPDLFDKEGDQMIGRAGEAPVQAAPEMYIRQKSTSIAEAPRPNESGSLFNPEDERNHLFTSSAPHSVGRYLDILVVSPRSEKKAPGAQETKPSEVDAKADPIGADEQEILKAIPELEPAVKGDPVMLKNFKVRIVHRYPNGDVLVSTARRSVRDDLANDINIQARLPYARLAAGDQLTTQDLFDVRMTESAQGEFAERTSSGWEDEYTLRLSGFDEAKSRMALELEDKRRQLASAAEKLETKTKAFSSERREFVKQREELARKKSEQETQVQGLEDKIKEQQSTIEEQQQELEELQPKDKPSDKKEGE